MDLAIAFGKVLRRLRLEARLSQAELALAAGLGRNYVSILELGRQQPTITVLLKIASAFNRPASELMELVESELRTAPKRFR